jgi:DNA-binding helix-hairpin-helix protein with protein kinase domain
LWQQGLIQRRRKLRRRLGLDEKNLGILLWGYGCLPEREHIATRANGQRHVQCDGEGQKNQALLAA